MSSIGMTLVLMSTLSLFSWSAFRRLRRETALHVVDRVERDGSDHLGASKQAEAVIGGHLTHDRERREAGIKTGLGILELTGGIQSLNLSDQYSVGLRTLGGRPGRRVGLVMRLEGCIEQVDRCAGPGISGSPVVAVDGHRNALRGG